jgi:hypothetical protein
MEVILLLLIMIFLVAGLTLVNRSYIKILEKEIKNLDKKIQE